jgi:D-amino-acid dehydrogenase
MVGLATAWFLQKHGVEVTVMDRRGVAAGASWGNAGWLTPNLAAPLPEPALLRQGVKALVDPRAPVYVPPQRDPRMLGFLWSFARHSTQAKWRRSMAAYVPLVVGALEAFDTMENDGVASQSHREAPVLASFTSNRVRSALLHELEEIERCGVPLSFESLSGDQARDAQPCLSDRVVSAIRLHGQRFIDPAHYVAAIAESVRLRGGTVLGDRDIVRLDDDGSCVRVHTRSGEASAFSAVVIASGAWLDELAAQFGVRTHVQAGRGYSMSVSLERPPDTPLYFPAERLACTPWRGELRIAGTMELRRPDAPADERRQTSLRKALEPLLVGLAETSTRNHWVGSRPCTPDGRPLVGRTRSPRVFVAGGHGMWGIVLGPVTGRALAQSIASGEPSPILRPFDPLR